MDEEGQLWLPELIYPEVPGQIDDEYLDRLYAVFERDFILSKPEWAGPRFAVTMRPNHVGWPSTFWHIISEGPIEHKRKLKSARCAALVWIRPILEEFVATHPAQESLRIKWWRNKRGSQNRLLVATADFRYLVVLSERREYLLLWTAYPTRAHTAHKLKQEFYEYWRLK